MKTVDKLPSLLVAEIKPFVKVITYKHAASGVVNKRKGYSLYAFNASMTSIVEWLRIEPVNYSNGDKWLVSGDLLKYKGFKTLFYAKNIYQVYNKLK